MNIALVILLVIPIALAVWGTYSRRYYCNLGVTGSCALLLLLSGHMPGVLPLIAALAVSIVGDYFMAHQRSGRNYYLYGICGFGVAHALYIWYAAMRFSFNWPAAIAAIVLAALYGVYLAMRVLPQANDMPMRIAICVYASVSIMALAMALCLSAPAIEKALYALGVASILFSDTIIAQSDFAGDDRFSFLIMPTYFGCHVLVTASVLIGALL